MLSRKKLLRQSLSIYFNEWQEKRFEQSPTSNQSFFKPLTAQTEEHKEETCASFLLKA